MSLLLDALKQAELAKQKREIADSTPGRSAARVDPLSPLDGSAAPVPPVATGGSGTVGSPFFTREDLPGIEQAEGQQLASPAPALSLEAALPPPARGTPADAATFPPASRNATARSAARPWDPPPAEQAAARQVFLAKELDANPRRPFYLALASLALLALAALGYFAWELNPHSDWSPAAPSAPAAQAGSVSTQAAQPGLPAAGGTVAGVPAAAGPGAAAAAGSTAQSQPGPAQPGQDVAHPVPMPIAPKNAAAQPPAAAAPATVAAPQLQQGNAAAAVRPPAPRSRSSSAAIPAAARSSPASEAVLQVSRNTARVDPTLEAAYQALVSGDLQAARQGYAQAVRAEPTNRDALLGLAAIEVRRQDYASAAQLYEQVLTLDPRDATAIGALLGLRGSTDPVQAESRLKTLLAQQPDLPILQFFLGNQYAAQLRWPEAQAAYFNAFAGSPDNADFAFNLAVSLDQLEQHKVALDYYRKALALADEHPGQTLFDRTQATRRIAELAR